MKGVRGSGRKKIDDAQLRQEDDGSHVGAGDAPHNDSPEEDEEEEEEEEKGGADEEERPKLDEGFYEIEDVRRKRVRKGQIQYLIKWRGWPETANTWEPLENLQSCSDVIEAFEDSLRLGRHRLSRCSRKRKRKHGGLHMQPKKKQHPTSATPGARVGINGHQYLFSPSLENPSLSKSPLPERMEAGQASEYKDQGQYSELSECVGLNNVTLINVPAENVSTNVPLEDDQLKEADPICSKLKETFIDKSNDGKFLTNISDIDALDHDGLKDEFPKVECMNPVQSSRFTGAKKRKSGYVRRFRQDSTLHELDEAQNAIPRFAIESSDRFESIGVDDVESLGNDTSDKTKLDALLNPSSITKIIKAIGYSASISNNVQDVSVTFVAMRSDGREVVVDSKFLKVNNPLLLISFYEQHLRYTPQS